MHQFYVVMDDTDPNDSQFLAMVRDRREADIIKLIDPVFRSIRTYADDMQSITEAMLASYPFTVMHE